MGRRNPPPDYPDSDLRTRAADPDRKRGILTTKDRRYLLGDVDVEGQAKHNLLFRLRERLEDALLDLLLLEYLSDEELGKISESLSAGDTNELHSGLIRFTYRYILANTSESTAIEAFERSLPYHIQHLSRHGGGDEPPVTNASVEIEVERSDLDSLVEQMENADGPYDPAAMALHARGRAEEVEKLRELDDNPLAHSLADAIEERLDDGETQSE